MTRLPTVAYFVSRHGKLPWGKKGGGMYTLRAQAERQASELRQYYNAEVTVYEAELTWKETTL